MVTQMFSKNRPIGKTDYSMKELSWMVNHNGDGMVVEFEDKDGNKHRNWNSSLDYRARTHFIRHGFLYGSKCFIKSTPLKGVIIRKYDTEHLTDGELSLMKGYKNYIVFSQKLPDEVAEKYKLEFIER